MMSRCSTINLSNRFACNILLESFVPVKRVLSVASSLIPGSAAV